MFYNFIKFFASVAIFLFVAWFFISSFEYITYSPDAIRFIHFWQLGFSGEQNFINSLIDALKASHEYDLSRGRIVLYLIYGLDTIFLFFFKDLYIWLTPAVIIFVNSYVLANLIQRNIKNKGIISFLLIFITIFLNAISLSPLMGTALYAKYICFSFLLIGITTPRVYLKSICFILAGLSDELGLIGVIIYLFLHLLSSKISIFSSFRDLIKASIKPIMICMTIGFTYISIVYFLSDSSPNQFARYTGRSIFWFFDPSIWFERLLGMGWYFEVLFLGYSFKESIALLCIIAILLAITIANYLNQKTNLNIVQRLILIPLIGNRHLLFVMILMAATFIILPPSLFKYETYSYPLFLLTCFVFIFFLDLVLKDSRRMNFLMLLLILIKVFNSNEISDEINFSNKAHHLKDNSVRVEDLRLLNLAAKEIRNNNNYKIFDQINNYQEIDFSGMWYYSRIDHFRSHIKDTDSFYFPVEGTVRVLSWPYFKRINQEELTQESL